MAASPVDIEGRRDGRWLQVSAIDQDVDFVLLFYIVKMIFSASSGRRAGERQYRSKVIGVCLGSEKVVYGGGYPGLIAPASL